MYLKNLIRTIGLFCLWMLIHPAHSQIAGIINAYTEVIDIDFACPKLTVSSTAGFSIGDHVLIIQMKGASVVTYNNAGNYEFAEIENIDGLDIYLKYRLLKDYTPSGIVQLVTVPQYTSVTVTGTLTAQPWDGTKGGILVFEASGTVTLEADIEVSGLGFKGGLPNIDDGSRPLFDLCQTSMIFPNTSAFGAGKGECITAFSIGAENGRGKVANGGGGGLWNNSGGGGGSNYNLGGRGGNPGACFIVNHGIPGAALTYSNALNKVFLGGGGGGGHQNNKDNGAGPPTAPGSTPGGNGGGMVIIAANTLDAQGHAIQAQGKGSVAGQSFGDGGGGGGGGGTVLLDINDYVSPISIDVSGGDGDDLYIESGNSLGPGGGGGGGVVWTSGAATSPNITATLAGGVPGINFGFTGACNCSNGAAAGGTGGILNNLLIPKSTIPATPCTTPLKLLDFSLRNTASGITITWTTAQDDESRMFELQKSSNGLNFETFTSLPAQSRGGIHDYVITDYEEPSGTIVYYRLIQIDKNEHRKTLGTQSMMLNKQDAFVESHPNPFNEKLQIKALKHLSSVEIFDSSGKYLLVVSEVGEHTTLEINATAWSQGLYILKTTIEGEQFYQKLVK